MEITPSVSAAIAAIVGIGLYSVGIIPIGLLIVVGIAMVGVIFKGIFKSKKKRPE